jgi:hypothetical protein
MAYSIGCITVDESLDTPSAVFPIRGQWGWQLPDDAQVIIHQFGNGDGKIEQRFRLGPGRKTFVVNLQPMSPQRRKALVDFWNQIGGPQQAFYFDAPDYNNQTTTRYTCTFDPDQALAWTKASDLTSNATVNLVVVPPASRIVTYTSSEITTRFPSSLLRGSLLYQESEIIPLITVTPRWWYNNQSLITFGAVSGNNITVNWSSHTASHTALYVGGQLDPNGVATQLATGGASGSASGPNVTGTEFLLVDTDTHRIVASNVLGGTIPLYLSDRLCSIDGTTYRPRLISHSGISQSLGPADDATFQFANADRVFTRLKNLMNLNRADVQFCLFHVQTRSQVQLWRGEAKSWAADENAVFQLQCSDSIYELTLPYPSRRITRECYKPFNDGHKCPYSTAGSGGNPTYCDKLFDSPQGCQSHGMDNYFGGITATPQNVAIRDNGSSGRPTITASSIVSDTMYGKTLQEVYTNIEMPVPCIIADGRDESEFYEAIGIVGAGRIASFGPVANQLLDGQTQNYPYSPIMVLGDDPNVVPFSLDAGGNFQYPYKAAGVAWLSIRRTDPKGIQPSNPDDHQMVASITGGLQGLVWTGPGTNSSQVLTNPIWVFVNALLCAKNMGPGIHISIQEAQFSVADAVAAAAICDLQTPTLVYNRNPVQLPVDGSNIGVGNWTPINGTQPQLPNETQFQFVGIIDQEQPLRDWLDQIMLNCNGYWFTAFGKIVVGIKTNASAVEAFTIGNMLWKSFADSPYAPESGSYNDLTATYNDRDYKFARNTARYYDQDHALILGSTITPRYEKGQINLVGTCTASQALRVAATKCREAIGGVDEYEWKSARTATWKTTVLALNTWPGQVVSVTHPDVSNGYAKYRIQSWTLHDDYSISIKGSTVTDSMYDLDAGPKPMDVGVPVLPIAPGIQTIDMPSWAPCMIARPDVGFNGTTFRLDKVHQLQPDGSTKITFLATGRAPVTSYFTTAKPKLESAVNTRNGTSGPFGYPSVYHFAVSALTGTGEISAPSEVRLAKPTAPDDGAVQLSGMVFPTGTTGMIIYSGVTPDLMRAVYRGPFLSPYVARSLNSGITSVGSLGIPPAGWQNVKIRLKAKAITRFGLFQTNATSIDVPNRKIFVPDGVLDAGGGATISYFGNPNADSVVPVQDYPVTAFFNGLSGTSYLIIGGTDDLSGISAGDVIASRYYCGFRTTTSIGMGAGLVSTHVQANDSVGKLVRIISGTGAGQVRQIISNDQFSTYTVSQPWTVLPSRGQPFDGSPVSQFIIEDGEWLWESDSPVIVNSNPSGNFTVPITIPDLTVKSIIIIGVLTSNGYESPEIDAPYREVAL